MDKGLTDEEIQTYGMHYCQCSTCEKVRELQTADRDREIAREAFEAGRTSKPTDYGGTWKYKDFEQFWEGRGK